MLAPIFKCPLALASCNGLTVKTCTCFERKNKHGTSGKVGTSFLPTYKRGFELSLSPIFLKNGGTFQKEVCIVFFTLVSSHPSSKLIYTYKNYFLKNTDLHQLKIHSFGSILIESALTVLNVHFR